jgi:hypothetical protein
MQFREGFRRPYSLSSEEGPHQGRQDLRKRRPKSDRT